MENHLFTRVLRITAILLVAKLNLFAQDNEQFPLRRMQVGAQLNIDSPFKSVMPEMTTSGSFGLAAAYSPFLGSPLYFELKASWGVYSSNASNNIYYAKKGWWYPAEASYSSGFQKYLVGPKVMVGKEFRKVRGFVTPQIGLFRIRSKTVVKYWDGTGTVNESNDGSKQANRTPNHQTGFVYGGEVGVEISLDKLFKIKEEKNMFNLVVSGSFLRSFKNFSYTDVANMLTQSELGDENPNQYILMSHPNVDEVKYVKTYNSLVQLWGVNVGMNFNF
jgi:hypothetical protein